MCQMSKQSKWCIYHTLFFVINLGFDQHEDLLLIVTFYRREYNNIPLLEVLYRPHFKVGRLTRLNTNCIDLNLVWCITKQTLIVRYNSYQILQNILYCGEPDEIVDEYMRHYHGFQGAYFSFLPTHTKTGYECILGAVEMGYNVEGFLLINQDTLINSWNFKYVKLL